MRRNIFSLVLLAVFLQLTPATEVWSAPAQDHAASNIKKELPTIKESIEAEVSGKIDRKKVVFLEELKSGKIKQSLGGRLMGIVGCLFMLALAVLLSLNRKKISWKLVGIGITLQFAFAFVVLKLEIGQRFFKGANTVIVKILQFSTEGARFLFGNLVYPNVPIGIPTSPPPTFAQLSSSEFFANTGAFFAFNVLPTIIFFSALTAVLYHLRVLEYFVRFMAFIMQKTLGTSGAESFSAAANIFVGQTEAPLLIRPFLNNMTKSEIMAVMTGGFATVAGGVMAAYVGTLQGFFPDIAGHLLAASVMSAPASLVMAKIMVPEIERPETGSASEIVLKRNEANVIDAAAKGTSDGLHLALNVGAMLIAFIALIAFINWIISAGGGLFGYESLSLENIFSFVLAPFAFLLGVPWADAPVIGALLGTKTVVNEFVAYIQLAGDLGDGTITNTKSIVIATYALCGFSNFSSIGIQIGGLTALAPERRHDFARLGLRAMIAGSLACFQTAAIAGMLL